MSGEGFLGRWSRRKREAARGLPEPGAEALPPAPAAEAETEPQVVPAFDPASLPPIESLTETSDFAAFLRAEVPAALRQAALRRAWTLDPTIRDFVGPADYAWDYNAPDGVPGFAHTLGGDVKRLLAQAIGALDEAVAEEPAEAKEEVAVPVEAAPAVPEPEEAPLPMLAEDKPPLAEAPNPAPPRRRHGGAMPV